MKIAVILNDQRINQNQLTYILQNFAAITSYDYSFSIEAPTKQVTADLFLVYGTEKQPNYPRQIIIPFIAYIGQPESYKLVDSDLDFTGKELNNKLPVLEYSIIGNRINAQRNEDQITLNIDVLWNIFFHMSLYPEYLYEQQHGDLGSYFHRLQIPVQVVEIPIVNCLFSLLENLINSFENVGRKNPERKFTILLTHDIDAIRKTWLHRSKQTAFYGFNCLRYLKQGKLQQSFASLGRAVKLFFTSVNYNTITRVIAEDQKYTVTTIFFIFVKTKQPLKMFKLKIYNPQYDVFKPKVKAIFQEIKNQEIMAGLHGSYSAYRDLATYTAEKTGLEKGFKAVKWNRNHWLNFSITKTFDILEKNGIRYDSTLGFNDQIGFRSGLCTPYFPYNFIEERAYRLLEYSLNIMDCTLYNYLQLDNEEALRYSRQIKEWVKKFDGTLVLNWHNHVYTKDYNWHVILDELLKEEKQ